MHVRLRLGLLAIALAAGCSEGPTLTVDKSYCERDRSDGDCISLRAEKDGDPATIGRIAVKSRLSDSYLVRRAGKKKYTLHRDGKIAGAIVMGESDWITVTLTDGAPYSKTMRLEGVHGVME